MSKSLVKCAGSEATLESSTDFTNKVGALVQKCWRMHGCTLKELKSTMDYSGDIKNERQINGAFRSPTRISITVPHCTYQHLLRRSDAEGRSLSNLAAFLLELTIEKSTEKI